MIPEEQVSEMNWADYFDSLSNQHLKKRIEEARAGSGEGHKAPDAHTLPAAEATPPS